MPLWDKSARTITSMKYRICYYIRASKLSNVKCGFSVDEWNMLKITMKTGFGISAKPKRNRKINFSYYASRFVMEKWRSCCVGLKWEVVRLINLFVIFSKYMILYSHICAVNKTNHFQNCQICYFILCAGCTFLA